MENGWTVLKERNTNSDMSEYEINITRAKIHCVMLARKKAVKHMGRSKKDCEYRTWDQCCDEVPLLKA